MIRVAYIHTMSFSKLSYNDARTTKIRYENNQF